MKSSYSSLYHQKYTKYNKILQDKNIIYISSYVSRKQYYNYSNKWDDCKNIIISKKQISANYNVSLMQIFD